jgi:hypothetical protein
MEYYDGNKVAVEINTVMRDVNWSFLHLLCSVCVLTIVLWKDYF